MKASASANGAEAPSPAGHHPTIRDVARRAGVSLQTISRVLNGKAEVSPETRERILHVIRELDYRPSTQARGLATRKTYALALVIPDISNPFFADVTRGVEDEARARGYNVFLLSSDEDPAKELDCAALARQYRADGIILCSPRLDEAGLRQLVSRLGSVVLVNREIEGEPVPCVLVDNARGGYEATRHLLALGHRRIGIIVGPTRTVSGRQRFVGYQRALGEYGVDVDPALVAPGLPRVDSLERVVVGMLGQPRPPTAIFAYNDLVAAMAVAECIGRGLRVPDDISVVGFDGVQLASLVNPPLTTLEIPRHELGRSAVRMLLRSSPRQNGELDRIVFAPRLRPAGSTAPPPCLRTAQYRQAVSRPPKPGHSGGQGCR